MRYFSHELAYSFTHADRRGIFFTIKALFTRPGHMLREYILGRRANYFRPFPLLIILATLFGITAHLVEKKWELASGTSVEQVEPAGQEESMEEWLEDIAAGYSDAVRESAGDTVQVSQAVSQADRGGTGRELPGLERAQRCGRLVLGASGDFFRAAAVAVFCLCDEAGFSPCGGYALQLCGVSLRVGVYVLSAVYSAAGTAPDGFCVERQFVGLGFGDIFRSVGLDIQAVFRDLGAPFVLADFVAVGDPVRESGRFCVARIDGGSADGVVDYGGCLEVKTAPGNPGR